MSSSQIERMRLYMNRETKEVSPYLMDILPQSLTVNRHYKFPWCGTDSLFEEVATLPPPLAFRPGDQHLFQSRPDVEMDEEETLDVVLRNLELFVEEEWKKSRRHIVQHSSGLDSRILSQTIKNIYERLGPEWLGEVWFICFGPECDEFRKIMQYEGWTYNNYICVVDEYAAFSQSLAFELAWNWLNGPVDNAFGWHALEVLALKWHWISREWLSEGYQLWSGYGANECLTSAAKHGGSGLWSRVAAEYKSISSVGRFLSKNVVYPFRARHVLRPLVRSITRMGSVRQKLLRRLDPDLMAFENVQWRDTLQAPADLLLQSVSDYESSWFHSNVKAFEYSKHFMPTAIGSPWWVDWSSAAICQHLLEEGYELK